MSTGNHSGLILPDNIIRNRNVLSIVFQRNKSDRTRGIMIAYGLDALLHQRRRVFFPLKPTNPNNPFGNIDSRLTLMGIFLKGYVCGAIQIVKNLTIPFSLYRLCQFVPSAAQTNNVLQKMDKSYTERKIR